MRSWTRGSLVTLAALLASATRVPSRAHAQFSLTGTYITYVAIGSQGSMVDSSSSHGMAYTETGSPPTTCDVWWPGSPTEGFFVHATGTGGLTLDGSTTGTFGGIPTTTTTRLSGRTITWSGTLTGSGGSVRIDQTYELQTGDRFVTMTAVITNTGTSDLTDVYYGRIGDADHGQCAGGSLSFNTNNDVVEQPPTDEGALATAGAMTPAGFMVVGIGTHDDTARATNGFPSGFSAATTWASPTDHAGMSFDEQIAVIFRTSTLPAGASVTDVAYYVWGPDVMTVRTRFDDLGEAPCTGADGDACTSGSGVAGLCELSRCCVGCWDGTRCHAPGSTTACGIGGGSCSDCTDANTCTVDSCGRTDGVCAHTFAASGTVCNDGRFCTATDACNATGTCVGTGSPCDDLNACTSDTCDESVHGCVHSPLSDGASCLLGTAGTCHANACCTGCWDGTTCQFGGAAANCGRGGGACANCVDGDGCTDDVCSGGACSNPLSSMFTACNDGTFCTAGDHCDGADHCVPGTDSPCDDGSVCTTDICNETSRTCSHGAASGICSILGSCFAAGDVNPSNPCLACDPTHSSTTWSANSGGSCGSPACALGMLTPAPTCDDTGACVAGARMRCPSGMCVDPATCATTCAMDADCGSTSYCDATTEMCLPRFVGGTPCDRTSECAVGVCSHDGHCCASACDGPCESCTVAGAEGRCVPVPVGTDPHDDCPGDMVCGRSGCIAAPPDAGLPPDAGVVDDAGDDDAQPPHDAGSVPLDASSGHDAGAPAPASSCCSVAVGGGERVPTMLLLALGIVVAMRRRRRD